MALAESDRGTSRIGEQDEAPVGILPKPQHRRLLGDNASVALTLDNPPAELPTIENVKTNGRPSWLRALRKYIDQTGRQPKVRHLEDLEPKPARRAALQASLHDADISAHDFLVWRDILSTHDVDAAINRWQSWRDEVPATSSRMVLPLAIWDILLQRPASADAALHVLRVVIPRLDDYNADERPLFLVRVAAVLAQHDMLAALQVVLEAFKEATRSGPTGPAVRGMLAVLARIVRLRQHRGASAEMLDGGRKMIEQLVRHVITHTPYVVSGVHRALADPRVLNKRTRLLLYRHFRRQGETMPPSLVRACFTAAAREQEAVTARIFYDLLHPDDTIDSVDTLRDGILLAWAEERVEDVFNHLDAALIMDDPELSRQIWTMLFTFASHSGSMTASQWTTMQEHAPEGILTGAAKTAMLHSMLRRNQPAQALQAWEEMVASGELFVDAVALSVPATALMHMGELERAVRLVDQWAVRSNAPPPPDDGPRVQIDTQTVNLLMEGCRRLKQPNVAYRMWQAMLPRWGVRQDSLTLTSLIHCARHADAGGRGGAAIEPSLGGFARAIARAFRSDAPEEDRGWLAGDDLEQYGWARGPTSVLFDRDADRGRPLIGWQIARLLLRTILFDNWPGLQNVRTPLAMLPTGSGLNIFGSSLEDDEAAPDAPPPRLIPSTGHYAHLTPSASTFHAYIHLLGYRSLTSEIPLALAWMHALRIVPHRRTLTAVLMYVGETEGPARLVRVPAMGKGNKKGKTRREWLRDEEVLRVWLARWLGEKAVPSVEEVAELRRGQQRGLFHGG